MVWGNVLAQKPSQSVGCLKGFDQLFRHMLNIGMVQRYTKIRSRVVSCLIQAIRGYWVAKMEVSLDWSGKDGYGTWLHHTFPKFLFFLLFFSFFLFLFLFPYPLPSPPNFEKKNENKRRVVFFYEFMTNE